MKTRNPFVAYGYEGSNTFCDRRVEAEKPKAALLYDTDDEYVVYDRLFGFGLARLPR